MLNLLGLIFGIRRIAPKLIWDIVMGYIVNPSKEILVLVLENSCQNACPHCFLNPGKGNWRQAKQVAIEAFELGYSVYFYATEITRECYNMYKLIGQDLEDSSICVKGDLASKNYEWLLKKKGRVGFSLHGAKKETHELVTGQDTFAKTIEAIQFVSKYNTSAKINVWSVLHKKNKNELRDLCELTRDLGVHYINFAKLSYLGRARNLDQSWHLNRDDIEEIVFTIETIYNSGDFPTPHITLSPNWGMTYRQFDKFVQGEKLIYYPTRNYCPAGRQHFTVESNTLKIYPCHHLSADA